MKRIFIFAAAAFVATSCVESGVEEIAQSLKNDNLTTVTVTVSSDDSQESRVAVDDNWAVSWIDGESLLGWSVDGDFMSEFEMDDYADKSATFTGGVSGENYRLISPYNSDANIVNGLYSIDLTSQSEGATATHMINKELIYGDDDTALYMMHVGAGLVLNATFDNLSQSYPVASIEITGLPSAVVVDLTKSVDSADFYSEVAYDTITINDIDAEVSDYNSYKFNILPGDQIYEIGVTIGLTIDANTTAYLTSTILSDSAIEIKRATYNTLNLTFDMDAATISQEVTLSLNTTDALADQLTAAGYTDLTTITSLTLTDGNLTLDDLTTMQGMTSLKNLDFSACTAANSHIPASWMKNNTTLESIVLSPSITTFYGYIFNGCTSLKSIDLSNIGSTGNYAFQGCTSLTSVILKDGATVSQYCFDGCTALEDVDLSKVSTINVYAFQGCTSLKSIDLSNITATGNYSFQDCTSLTSVTFGEGTVSTSSFMGCTSLGEVDLSKIGTVGTSAFSGCTNLTLAGDGDLTSITTEIWGYAFYNCTSITQITLPEDVSVSNIDHIKANSFEGCTSLSQINIPSGVKQIYGSAFKGCTSLTSIELPNTITNLALSSFEGSGLTSITIPNNASDSDITLGDLALANCPNLKSVVIESTTMVKVGADASTAPFYGSSALESIKVPADLVDTYKESAVFADVVDIISAIE